ncbi:hypothetical protein ACFSTC_35210 [Nonomuraea ferruginea]
MSREKGGGDSSVAGSSEGESASATEKSVRTRSLFEPASPAGAQRPPSSAESAKAQGPLPKGAASRDTRPSEDKAENGRTAPGDSSDVDDARDQEPAEAANGDSGAKGSGTVKVIVGTRRYHSTACPLIKGGG